MMNTMDFRLGEILFLGIFLLLCLLLLLLGESYLSIYLFSGFIIFYFFNRSKIEFSLIEGQKTLLGVWILFLLSILFSFVFSHNIPVSLDKVVLFFFCFISFFFFYLLRSSTLKKNLLISFLQICLVLVVLSYGVQIFDTLGNRLPGMNVIYPTYGHNHISALILLFLPLSWYFAVLQQKKTFPNKLSRFSRLWLLLPVFFTLSLLITYGRTSLALGFFQFILLISFLKNEFNFKAKATFLGIIGMLFCFILVIKVIFSLSFASSFTDIFCSVPSMKTRLCKPISSEVRPSYWLQAFRATKDYPWTGYGPGTFQLISTKYRQLPYINSAYAHNVFLQQFAELGIFGGTAFTVLMVYMLYKAYVVVRKEKGLTLKKSVFIGIVFSYLNSFFDFDWSFIGLFLLCLLGLAYVLSPAVSEKKDSKKLSKYLKIKMVGVGGLILFFGLISFVTEVLIRLNYPNLAISFFPYISSQQYLYSQKNISKDQLSRLMKIYQFDSKFLQTIREKKKIQLTAEEQVKLLTEIDQIDPWYQVYNSDLYVIFQNSPDLAWERFENTVQILGKAKENYSFDEVWRYGENVAPSVFEITDEFLKDKNFNEAAKWYLGLAQINPWQLCQHVPIILTGNGFTELDRKVFYEKISSIDSKYLCDMKEQYIQ